MSEGDIMKKLFALPLAAVVALGACADFQGAVAPNELDLKAAEPGTDVSVQFNVGTPGTPGVYRTVPVGNNGHCEANGEWFQHSGQGGTTHTSKGVNHEQCTDVQPVEGSAITVSFTGEANYVVAGRSGNIHLNFSICGYTENEETLEWEPVACEPSTFVHYKKSSNFTEGSGAIIGKGSDGSEWVIDLSRIGHAGNAGMLAKTLTFPIYDAAGEVASATLDWNSK
jgi:hypothetical protein